MPALIEGHKLSEKAAATGFDWPNVEGLFDKLAEETGELREELKRFPAPGPRPLVRGVAGSGRQDISPELRERLEEEVGDLFFVLVNVARYLRPGFGIGLKENESQVQAAFSMDGAAPAGVRAEARAGLDGRLGESVATSQGTGKGVKSDAVVIRSVRELEEMRAAVALQKEVWNFTDAELVPLRLFVVAEKVGGQVIGAFDGKRMVGFALSVPGVRAGHPYLHSHMLAVRAELSQWGAGPADQTLSARGGAGPGV